MIMMLIIMNVYLGNTRLVYSILRNQEAFLKLSKLSLLNYRSIQKVPSSNTIITPSTPTLPTPVNESTESLIITKNPIGSVLNNTPQGSFTPTEEWVFYFLYDVIH